MMTRLIAPDEFNYIVSTIGQPKNVKLGYTPLDAFDFGLFSRDLRKVLPNYGLGVQPTLVTVLELHDGRESESIPIRELYRLSFKRPNHYPGVIQDVDGKIYPVDKHPESRTAHIEFIAARWKSEIPHLPSVILTPEALKIRKISDRSEILDELVSWAFKQGITADSAVYDAKKDYKTFISDWENSNV